MLCDNLEAWDRVGDGEEVQEGGGIGIPMAGSCLWMADQHNIVKQLSFD